MLITELDHGTLAANAGIRLDRDAVEAFEARLRGRLLQPQRDGYDDARRLWNGMIDKRPRLIARCKGTADVIAAVRFARTHGLAVAVRGGGHNVAGLASIDDGIVIDLSEMNGVHVDPERRVVRAEGGATIGDLDHETQAFGYAVPMGVVSETGIAGLTLSGGIGWLRNKHGLSCDALIAADVVTSDGQRVRASETENSDLLWGLRGGGGAFGVVTALEYRLHALGPDVMFAFVLYPRERATEILRAYRDYVERAPDEVSSIAALGMVPDEPSFPEAFHHAPHVMLAAMYAGDPEDGRRALEPLRAFGESLLDASDVMPYTQAQRVLDQDYPNGRRYYWTSTYLHGLDDAVIADLIESAEEAPSRLSTVDVWPMGGAVRRVEPGATAFGPRSAPYLLGIEANWDDPAMDEENLRWGRTWLKRMQRFGGGIYLNFPGFPDDEGVASEALFGQNRERLVDLKTTYDPESLFRTNHGVEPRAASMVRERLR